MPTFTVYKGSKGGKITQAQTTRPDLTANQVLVKVTASGLCGTDIHYREVDMALGHEGAGVVEAVGPDVQYLKKGDRVGWGYQHGSCGACNLCLTGKENYCEQREMYAGADLDQGSFASHGVWRESFLFRIPDEMSDAEAAPLMCGGATVFNALASYDIRPTDRVGVIGIGGLGHLAIQFAAKMGCDVVVLSGSPGKEEEAKQLGARKFVAMKGKKAGEIDIGRKLDVLIVTTSFSPDWSVVLPIMAAGSTIFPLTVAKGDFSIPHMGFVLQGITIQGSVVAARKVHRDMLAFAAQHKIKPIMMEFPMNEEGITKAMDTLNNGDMRYRGVLIPQ